MKENNYWKIRAEKYNELEWVSDDRYLDNLIFCSQLCKNQIVLDVGAGTGVVSKRIRDIASSVMALDISNDMLSKGKWSGISFIKWDIRERLFKDNIFDRIIARMVFHHILDDTDKAFERCYEYLKKEGKIIISEGVPPSSSKVVVEWFTKMFKQKEERIVFVPGQIENYLYKAGFSNIKSFFFHMNEFSINNWLESSGLPEDKINGIIKFHIDSPQEVKDSYDMKINGNNILIKSKYTIVVGEK